MDTAPIWNFNPLILLQEISPMRDSKPSWWSRFTRRFTDTMSEPLINQIEEARRVEQMALEEERKQRRKVASSFRVDREGNIIAGTPVRCKRELPLAWQATHRR